jgi:hypothetical protein
VRAVDAQRMEQFLMIAGSNAQVDAPGASSSSVAMARAVMAGWRV